MNQQGVDFEIIEASAQYGGRIKHTTTFTDFPISLGGEWLHVQESELSAIVNNPSVNITTQMQRYSATDIGGFYDGTYTEGPIGASDAGIDSKFVGSSWLGFFEE